MDQEAVNIEQPSWDDRRLPHRKLSSLEYLKKALMNDPGTATDQKEVLSGVIDEEYRKVLLNPCHVISEEVAFLRHSLWKAKAKAKKGGTDQDEESDSGDDVCSTPASITK